MQKAIDATNKVVAAGKSGHASADRDRERDAVGHGPRESPTRRVANVQALLGPAENFGGRTSFRRLVPFAAVAAVIFLLLWVNDQRRVAIARSGSTPTRQCCRQRIAGRGALSGALYARARELVS